MNVEILSQPISKHLGEVLSELTDEDWKNFYCIVAYAKHNGVLRIEPLLKKLKRKSTLCKFVVGIDQKNTSFEALQLLCESADELYIYHNEDANTTFHPKMYFFEGENTAKVIIGSHNLTTGGLYTNNEQSIVYTMDLNYEEDRRNFETLLHIWGYYSDTENEFCQKVSIELLEELKENGYLINDFQLTNSLTYSGGNKSVSDDRQPIFGRQRVSPPALPKREGIETKEIHISESEKISKSDIDNLGFWKKLSKWDVSTSSAPGQIIIPIRFMHLFPSFSGLTPTPSEAQQEEVYFNIIFESEGGEQTYLENVRAIHYVPAQSHGRPNPELRFTFKNRNVFSQLKNGDVLAFYKTNQPNIEFFVKHNPIGFEDSPNYGIIK